MNDDAILLRRYLEEGSEEAFTALVQNHIDLVYGAALRRTGDPHRAADVAQDVFTALARQARQLARHPVLSAWLHTTTRNLSVNLMISDQRRQQRQQAALVLATAQAGDAAPEWDRLRPVLDAAIDELPENDRQPIILRFLERQAYAQIGSALKISEDAARVRIDRALDKLRALLARRGITSTAAALGTVVSTHAAVSAPAGLGAVLAAESFAAASGGTGLLAAATSLATTKIIVVAVVSAGAAFALASYTSKSSAPEIAASSRVVTATPAPAMVALREENQRLKAELEQLRISIGKLDAAHAQLLAERAAPAARPTRAGAALGMPRHEIQQSILNNLRQLAAARDQYIFENKHAPSSIYELVGSSAYIRRLRAVDGEDYASMTMEAGGTFRVVSASGVEVVYGDDRDSNTSVELPPAVARATALAEKVAESAATAREAYRLANHGKDPDGDSALIPFFATAQQGADFVEYLEAQKYARKY